MGATLEQRGGSLAPTEQLNAIVLEIYNEVTQED